MNNTLEPSRPQTIRAYAQGDDSAEAAQRELFEFLASEAMASGLAADAALQAELAPPSVPDDLEATDEWLDAIADEQISAEQISDEQALPARAAALCDADGEACERAARSAAQAVDEATQENLRRLEATMSWLQNEVRSSHLPRAPQIAPVRGVPSVQAQPASTSAFDAIIDRSTLHRTVHGSSVHGLSADGSTADGGTLLPIWLREHEAPIRLPPPRRGPGLWRRFVKFFWVCAVAAPIAYVFAITTSPLHKHLADITGLAHVISSSFPALLGQHEPLRGRDLIAISPIAVEAAVGGDVAAAAPPDADRAGGQEAVPRQTAQPIIVTLDGSEPRAQAAPASESGAAPPPPDVGALTAQGKEFFAAGDLVAARILFTRAAKAGDAAAAVAMGATYDPVVLAEHGVRGVASDLDKARAWYERAKAMGSSEGPRRLEVLANR
jgi:hypothetical protein